MANIPTAAQIAKANSIITYLNATPVVNVPLNTALTNYQVAYKAKNSANLAQAIADLNALGAGVPL
jgi:hypothetical protein